MTQILGAWATVGRDNPRRAALRRHFAIAAYVGANGGGKTLGMIHDTLPSLDAGRPVLSTVRLLDYRNPRPCPGDVLDGLQVPDGIACDDPGNHSGPWGVHDAAHPLYTAFREYGQLLEFEAGDVLMDEVTGVASSRESHSMPVQVQNYLMQLRRRDVLLRWTAPNWARADKIIREVTQTVTDCSGRMPVSSRAADGSARLWRDRRLFQWRTFDAMSFDEFSGHKRDTLRPLTCQMFWRPGSVAGQAYSTLDPVLSLGWANDAGMCMVCGGRRSVPQCQCASTARRAESARTGTDGARPGGAVPLGLTSLAVARNRVLRSHDVPG